MRHRRTIAAFSLIELLAVVAVIAVLVAIAIPALRGSKLAATQSVYLAINRQLLAATRMYANNNDDHFPYMGKPGDPYAPITIRGYEYLGGYFGGQSALWLSIVVPDYYEPRDARIDVDFGEYPPGQHWDWTGGPEEIFNSQFRLTYGAFARPEYFDSDESPEDLSLLRATRWADIAFPSKKGLIADYAMASLAHRDGYATAEDQVNVAFADGTASIREFHPEGWESNTVERPGIFNRTPIMATRYGLRGRDY